MKQSLSAIVVALLLAASSQTQATNACLYGSAVNSDGSKIDGSARVSTSWNGKTAYPRNGKYELCLGSNPGKRITVYLDGDRYSQVHVDGNTQLNIRR